MALGDPLLLSGERSQILRRLPWTGSSKESFPEASLQEWIDRWPELLPIKEFYPNVESVCSLGREIQVGNGAIDNLILTDDGHLIVVETKLWRNPDAVREVVAQGLQYCMGISQMSSEEFEDRLKLSRTETFFELTSRLLPERADDFDEAFDRLRRQGNILLLIVGDCIRPSVERLVDWMNKAVGSAPYKLGLVELRCHELAGIGKIIVPRTLSKISEGSRHVVTINLQGAAKEQVTASVAGASAATVTRKISAPLSDEALVAQIKSKNPPSVAALVDELRSKLKADGLRSQGLSASISYGVQVNGDFIPLLSFGNQNMWFQIPRRAINVLGDERFILCKQRIDSVVHFFRPEDVNDPTKWASLCPRFPVLEGNVDALVEAMHQIALDVKDAFSESPNPLREVGALSVGG